MRRSTRDPVEAAKPDARAAAAAVEWPALVVPMALDTLQWATPLAAIGLGVTVLMAAGFHVRADERLPALETVLWASLTAVVAIGRWELIGPIEMPPMILIGAVVMLVPALVVNFIAILRSPLARA